MHENISVASLCAVSLLSRTDPTNTVQLLTDEAVGAFQSALQDGDFEPMKRMFVERQHMVRSIREQLEIDYNADLGEPDDEEMTEATRQILNAMVARFPPPRRR